MAQPGKELQELIAAAEQALRELDAPEAAIREAMKRIGELQQTVAVLQREAADVEFEEVAPAVRAFLDGTLLQRVRYVADRSQSLLGALRLLAGGVRDLRADCGTAAAWGSAPK